MLDFGEILIVDDSSTSRIIIQRCVEIPRGRAHDAITTAHGAIATAHAAIAAHLHADLAISWYRFRHRMPPAVQLAVKDYYRHGLDYTKEGNHSLICAMYGTYVASDGVEVYVLVLGAGVVPKVLALLGLDYGSELFPTGSTFVPVDTPAAAVLEEAFAAFLAEHTGAEVEEILAGNGIPCSQLMDYETARTHPQYVARGVITEWPATDGTTLIPGGKVVPEVAGHPGRVWRGAPTVGMDNDLIFAELGISDGMLRLSVGLEDFGHDSRLEPQAFCQRLDR